MSFEDIAYFEHGPFLEQKQHLDDLKYKMMRLIFTIILFY